MFKPIPPGTICVNCKKRLAVIWWRGYASVFEVNHGAPVEPWCKVCELEAQLEYHKEQARHISEIEKELNELRSKE